PRRGAVGRVQRGDVALRAGDHDEAVDDRGARDESARRGARVPGDRERSSRLLVARAASPIVEPQGRPVIGQRRPSRAEGERADEAHGGATKRGLMRGHVSKPPGYGTWAPSGNLGGLGGRLDDILARKAVEKTTAPAQPIARRSEDGACGTSSRAH